MESLIETTRQWPGGRAEKWLFTNATRSDGIAGQLEQVVLALLRDADPEIEPPYIGKAASKIGVNVRTLQRRLASENLTFRHIVERVRFTAASAWLPQPEMSVTEIAFDLGYQDVSHFSRAFRRWSGKSPRQYRQEICRSVNRA
jgi:AraC-like DNA-binding protein